MNIGTLSIVDEVAARERGRQLDELARGDFSSIASELTKAFPNTPDMQRRYVPLVQRYVAELSGLYATPLQRRFLPNGLAASVWQKLGDVYERSAVNAALEQVEQALWVQNTVVVVPMPVGPRRVQLVVCSPWQCTVDYDDPLRATDVAAWSRLVVEVPIAQTDGQVTWGQMTLTPTTAVRQVGGDTVGVYRSNGSHPFGRVPAVVFRRIDPAPGRWAAPTNDPLLSLTVALCLQESDMELLVHQQAWGQKVIEGAEPGIQPRMLPVGPDKIMMLYKTNPEGQSPHYGVVQGQPPIAQITSWQESRIRLFCAMLGISADAFLRVNTALTASARLFAAQDRQAVRNKLRPRLLAGEQGLAQMVAGVTNLSGLVQVPVDGLAVDVQWTDPLPSTDPVQEATALQAEVNLGVSSPVDQVMQREGLLRPAALALVKLRLAESKELGVLGKAPPAAPAPHATVPDQPPAPAPPTTP